MALLSFFKNLFNKKSQEFPVTVDLDVVKKKEVTDLVSTPELEQVEKKDPIKIEKKKRAQPKKAKEVPVKSIKPAKREPKKEKK